LEQGEEGVETPSHVESADARDFPQSLTWLTDRIEQRRGEIGLPEECGSGLGAQSKDPVGLVYLQENTRVTAGDQFRFVQTSVGFPEGREKVGWGAGFETYIPFAGAGCSLVCTRVIDGITASRAKKVLKRIPKL
jgi:hypothetical protein